MGEQEEELSEESEILGGTSADGTSIKPGRWLHEDRVGRETAEAYRLGVLEGRADAEETVEENLHARELLLRHLIVWRRRAERGHPTPMELNEETREFLALEGSASEALAVLRGEIDG